MIPIVVSFAAGAAVEFVNYLITRAALGKDKDLSAILPLRSVITAAFLAALYFAAKALVAEVAACMIAGAVGATVALAVFTLVLMNNNKKGGGTNG